MSERPVVEQVEGMIESLMSDWMARRLLSPFMEVRRETAHKIVALFDRPAVTREAVEKIVGRLDCSTLIRDPGNSYKCQYSRDQCGRTWGGVCPPHQKATDGLLALFNGKPRWCEHILWRSNAESPVEGIRMDNWYLQYHSGGQHIVHATCHVCPVCGTARPTP